MEIEDVRFLLSALIQALPAIISLSLIAVFALKPERGIIKDNYKNLLFLVLIFYIAIIFCVLSLYKLTEYIEQQSYILNFSIIISVVAIVYLTLFLLKIITTYKRL
jgi:predicted neutral ceramidase superfamily lipid hydrolase